MNGTPQRCVEEYITLRDEMMRIYSFARQIVYWTTAFIIVFTGWHLGQKPGERIIQPHIFAGTAYAFIFVSYVIFINQVSLLTRVGGFIAVFWESETPVTAFTWHRFNRHGGVKKEFLQDVLLYIYVGLIVIVMGSLLLREESWAMSTYVTCTYVMWGIGIIIIILFFSISWSIKGRTKRYEEEWMRVRDSQKIKKSIADFYAPKSTE